MNPVTWLAAVLLLYFAAGCTIVLFTLSFKEKNPLGGALIMLGAVAGIMLAKHSGLPSSRALLVGDVLALAIFAISWYAVIRPKMTWRDRKFGKETTRQTILHLVLMTGSAIFLVPFLWLLVTSLKEDEDMSQFPPVWVPRQQVKIQLDGKPAGLATSKYKGIDVTVGVLSEKESGESHVRVLKPSSLAGQEFFVGHSDLKKIKHFAPVWKNYPDALKFLPPETHSGLIFLWNTLILSFFTIIGTVFSSSLVAFSFSRLRWPGRDLCFGVLLATMMLPGAVTMMPVFLIFRWLGWIDTLYPIWVPSFFGAAFNIFLLRQFFMTIPNDLEEAARIDGCSYFGIYWRIMLPLIKPALAAITIMTFMGSWNNFMGPLIYISSPLKMPLAYALQLFQTAHGGEPGLLMAASTMMMLPVLVLFFFTQRYFIEGVTLTGIKG